MSSCLVVFEIKLMLKLSKLPNAELGYPVLGHFIMFLPGIGKSFMEYIMMWKNEPCGMDIDSGEPFTLHLLGRPVVFFTSEEDVAFVNSVERSRGTQPSFPEAIRELFGEKCIIRNSGKRHRVLRRILEPIFSPTGIEAYTKILDDLTLKHLDKWAKSNNWVSTKEFKILTLRLLLCVIFEGIKEELIWEFHDLLASWAAGFKTLRINLPGTTFYKALQAKSRMEELIGQEIADFKLKHSDGDQDAHTKTTFLGRLIYGTDEDGNRLSDDDIKSNIIFILFAGHDTTYASVGSFLHYLQKVPTYVRDALVDEVQNIKEPLDNDDLKNNAPILNAFLAETWRVSPPVAGSIRQVTTKESIQYKGYTIPTDSLMLICNYLSHEQYYGKTGNEFHIERWLPEDHPLALASSISFDKSKMKDYNQISRAFKTFGLGTHSCVGHYFAKFEARIIMARMFQGYDIKIRNSQWMRGPIISWSSEFQLTPRS